MLTTVVNNLRPQLTALPIQLACFEKAA